MTEQEKISRVIREWHWGNFGLDVVEDADPDYADHLAPDILRELHSAGGGPTGFIEES